MEVMFSPSKKCFYLTSEKTSYVASNNWPEDLVAATRTEFENYGLGEAPDGKVRSYSSGSFFWEDKYVDKSSLELQWINDELTRIRDELEKVQDSDTTAIGNVTDWRNYRKLVRSWGQHTDFPNSSHRPTAPDV